LKILQIRENSVLQKIAPPKIAFNKVGGLLGWRKVTKGFSFFI